MTRTNDPILSADDKTVCDLLENMIARHETPFPSLDLVFELVRDEITRQVADIDSLDTKATAVSAFVGALIVGSLAAFAGSEASGAFTDPCTRRLFLILMAVGELGLFASLLWTVLAFRAGEYHTTISPLRGPLMYLQAPEATTKRELILNWASSYVRNHRLIRTKARQFKYGIYVLMVSVLWLTVLVFVYAFMR